MGDIASIVGILGGFSLLFYAIYDGGGFEIFLDANSAMITIGGTLAATFISFPMGEVFKIFLLAIKVFYKQVRNPEELAKDIVQLAYLSRKGGNITLGREENQIGDSFLRYCIALVVDGVDPVIMKELMEIEIDSIRTRHMKGQKIFRSMAAFAPAFGLVGTLIGLIAMLKNLQDATKIGPAMAVAMITTFYGAIMANLILLPIAEKLEDKMEEEVFLMKLVSEGVVSLRRNINPKIIEKKLNAFLRTSKRFSLKGK
ncbi:MAG: hypothetical protein A2284_17005 [Deltaproteobacteria bacterium RIFOXYA12_FULL_61_11]|nr:MAG: hypothetical protein A2284_17005 [Deltaproteobacteria bacterium RIFOXYA12_FULL_61_11]